MLDYQASHGDTGFIKKMGQSKGWAVEIIHSQRKVSEWTLSTQQGSILNTTPFFLIFYLDYHDTWHYSLFYKEGCTNACLSYSQTTLALNVEPGGCYGGDRVFECILPM